MKPGGAGKGVRTGLSRMSPRDAEAMFEVAFQTASIPIVISRISDGCLLEVNEAQCVAFGFDREEMIGRTTIELGILTAEDRSRFVAAMVADGFVRDFELPFRRRDGTIRRGLLSGKPIDIDGESCMVVSTVDMTERWAAEEAQRANERQFREIFDNVGDGVAIADPQGFFLEVNRVVCERLGYSREQLLAMPVSAINAPEFAALIPERVGQIMQGGVSVFDTTHLRQDGTEIHTEVAARRIEFRGQPAILSVYRDITDRRRAEKRMREQSRLQQQLLDALPFPITAKGLDGRLRLVNAAFAEGPGRPREELIGKTYRELGQPDADLHEEHDRPVLETGAPHVYEADQHFPDGQVRRLLLTKAPLRSSNGEIDGIVTAGMDISDRYEAEQLIRHSEEQFRTLVNSAADGILLIDREGRIVQANPIVERVLGRRLQDLLGSRAADIMASVSLDSRPDADLTTLEPGESLVSERVASSADGAPVMLEFQVTAMSDGRFLVIARDITERRRAEARLRESEEKFSKAFHAAPVLIGLTDLETGLFLDVNDEALRVSGYSREEVIGHTSVELGWTSADNRELLRRKLEEEGRIGGIEMTFRTKNGGQLTGLLNGELISIGGRDCLLLTEVDISELKRAETEKAQLQAQLAQAQKMQAIGELAGGVAHDFNNMLTAIRGYAELARRGLGEDLTSQRSDLDEVIRSADRAAELTRQLLAFARKTVLEPRVLDPAAIVKEFAPMARRLLGEHIRLKLSLGSEVAYVRVDAAQLEQILLNLAVNARDAMPAGGQLTIQTSAVTLGSGDLAGHPTRRAGPFVVLAVRDTGVGMDAETVGRVFEPFFTTKDVGQGTGMGLSTVLGIVNMSDGWIEVQSAPGNGTTFTIYLPRVDERPGAEAAPEAHEAPAGSGTILFVEDDPAVRSFGVRCLRSLGYTVLEAPSGDDAIQIANGYADPIDLVVSDVVMPGMQGPKLAARLRSLRPRIRVLLCSGFADRTGPPQVGATSSYRQLSKPYSRRALGSAVRDALNGEAEG